MLKNSRLFLFVGLGLLSQPSFPQGSKPAPSSVPSHALELAKSGQCQQAIPLLKKAIPQSTDRDFRRLAGLAGVRCAMIKN